MKAMWNDTIIAESNDVVFVEGNAYFPHDSIKKEYFEESGTTTVCPWKGKAKYLSVTINGKTNLNGAWYYPKPSFLAKKIKDRIAFWNGIIVE